MYSDKYHSTEGSRSYRKNEIATYCGHRCNPSKNKKGYKGNLAKMSNDDGGLARIPIYANMRDLAHNRDDLHHNIFGK